MTADIPPRSQGTVTIDVGEVLANLRQLELSVIGVHCYRLAQETMHGCGNSPIRQIEL